MKCRVIVFINEGNVLAVKWLLYRCVGTETCKYTHLVVPCTWVILALCCRRSTYNHLSSWLTDARNLTNPNTVSNLIDLLWRGTGVNGFCSVFMLNGLLKSVWALQNKCWMLSVLSFCKTSVNHYAQTCVSDTELGSDALTNQPMHQLCAFFNQMHWNSAVPVRIVSCISRMVVLTFSFLSLSGSNATTNK